MSSTLRRRPVTHQSRTATNGDPFVPAEPRPQPGHRPGPQPGPASAPRNAHWYRWHIWQRVAEGTRPAQPFWHFTDRHRAEPAKYSLDKAQQQYLAQPRVAAMRTYNALPNKIMALPTSHLEAFQAGAHAYANLGLLSAVPADGMLTLDGRYLAAASGRLADQPSYLDSAQGHLSTLGSRDYLVALATA
jgi:hypothetical protein